MGMTRLVRHVAYLGDSILRTSFCRNLFIQLHDGDATGDCTYDPGLFEYQFTSKTFHLSSRPWCADPRGHVRFSQNSSTTVPTSSIPAFQLLLYHPEPVTHIITKLGLWFSAGPEELYQSNVEAHVENVYDVLGGRPSSTPYPSPHRSCE